MRLYTRIFICKGLTDGFDNYGYKKPSQYFERVLNSVLVIEINNCIRLPPFNF